jgi:hypothetical protein
MIKHGIWKRLKYRKNTLDIQFYRTAAYFTARIKLEIETQI